MYWFLAATLVAIVATSAYLIRSNRRLFAELASLSDQRRELAQNLIAARESTLRQISRELHDEFGQILTAIGSMLGRAGRHVAEDSPLRAELREVGEIAQSTLDNVRSLSQTLHPSILEELGLESTFDWYFSTVEKQLGLTVSYERTGRAVPVDVDRRDSRLSCAAGSAQQRGAALRRRREPGCGCASRGNGLELEVEDHGKGLDAVARPRGLGIVTMRERAELVGGTIEFLQAARRRDLGTARACREGRSEGMAWLTRSPCCSLTTTRSCGAASAGSSKTIPSSSWSARPATATKRSAWPTSLKPHVVVMDCAMPGTSGLSATRTILGSDPDIAILMLSMHSEETLVRQALEAGACGYVLKDALDLDLAGAVKRGGCR